MKTINKLQSKELSKDIVEQIKAGDEGTIPHLPYSTGQAPSGLTGAGQAIYNTGAAIWNTGATNLNAGIAAVSAFFGW